jgi:hypothetical protein
LAGERRILSANVSLSIAAKQQIQSPHEANSRKGEKETQRKKACGDS